MSIAKYSAMLKRLASDCEGVGVTSIGAKEMAAKALLAIAPADNPEFEQAVRAIEAQQVRPTFQQIMSTFSDAERHFEDITEVQKAKLSKLTHDKRKVECKHCANAGKPGRSHLADKG